MSDVDRVSTPQSSPHRFLRWCRAKPAGTAASVVAAIALLVVVLVAPVTHAGADPVSDTRNRVNQVNGQLQNAQAQAAQVAAQLQADATRLDVLAQQYEAAQEKVGELDAQLASTKAQIAQTQQRVDAAEATLRAAALQSYMSGATDNAFESLFSSGGEQSLVTQEYRRVASNHISSAIDALHQAQAALSTQQGELQTTEAQARAAAAQVAQAQQQAQATQAQQQAALGHLKGQIATLVAQKQQAVVAEQAAEYQAKLAAEQAAAAAAAAKGTALVNIAVSPGAGGAVQAAESQLGVPYQWGAESPKGSADPGFDCSGLTQWSWRQAGVSLPRTAQEQYDAIPHIPFSSLQPGDLIFWNDGTDSVQHVGMYVGSGNVVDAPHTGDVVRIQAIWGNGLVGAGRP
ncbi:MAG TPA: C40 family peptidase [Acidimicrobiales bacterium]|nr:C40 family peptidase [Acidimicrobiales bacterium]